MKLLTGILQTAVKTYVRPTDCINLMICFVKLTVSNLQFTTRTRAHLIAILLRIR